MKFSIIVFSLFSHFALSQINEQADLLSTGQHYISINGVHLWYKVAGKGPYLLVYAPGGGWGNDASDNIQRLKPLEKIRRVIYFEPRGIGHSAKIDVQNAYHLSNYVQELNTFLDQLGISSIDLLCFCYSKLVSMQFAIDFPDRVNHLILINASIFQNPEEKVHWISMTDYRQTMLNHDELQMECYDGWPEKSMYKHDRTSFAYQAYFERISHSVAINLCINDFNKNCKKIVDSLNCIKANTLIISEASDFDYPKIPIEILCQMIQNSELVILENNKSYLNSESSNLLFDKVISFLTQG